MWINIVKNYRKINLTTASTWYFLCHILCCRYAPDAQNAPSPAGAKIQVKQMFYGRFAQNVSNKKELIYTIVVKQKILNSVQNIWKWEQQFLKYWIRNMNDNKFWKFVRTFYYGSIKYSVVIVNIHIVVKNLWIKFIIIIVNKMVLDN
jgi:hypothetical protein